MYIEGIVVICEINVIMSCAADRSDLFNIIYILKDTHKSGNTCLNLRFVYNFSIENTRLRKGIIDIIEHDGIGTSEPHLLGYYFSSQITVHLSFTKFIRLFCFGFCLSRCLRLRLDDKFCLCLCSFGRCSLAAASRNRQYHCCAKC